MRSLRDVDARELVLSKPSWKSGVHELRAGADVVGLLDVSAWSSGSQAEAAHGRWRFERARGLRQRVRVLQGEGGLEHEVGVFARGVGGRSGTLELNGRPPRTLHARGLFKPRWSWRADDGAELIAFRAGATFGDEKGSFVLTDAGQATPDATLLLLLGAHLALLSHRESGAAAG